MENTRNEVGGLLDLSEVRQENKPVKKKVTLADLRKVLITFKMTGKDLFDSRVAAMVMLAEAGTAKVISAGNKQQELAKQLQFIDLSLRRMTDLVLTTKTLIKYHEQMESVGNNIFKDYPNLDSMVNAAGEAVVANAEKRLQETNNDEALLIMTFRDWTKNEEVFGD